MGRMKLAALVLIVMMAMTSAESESLEHGCGQKPADVVFVLDVSSSIPTKDFKNHMLTFVQAVVKELDVGPTQSHARVAAVTFSTRVTLEFYLHQYLDKDRLQKRVARIRSRGGNTNTHEALGFVDRYVFRKSRGARANVSRVVIVITDGASHKAKATADAARSLRGDGATIFAIGVGDKLDRKQLVDMASSPSNRYVFEVTNFEALDSIKGKLIQTTCQLPPTTTTTVTAPPTTTTTTTTTTFPTTTTTTTPPTTTTTTTTSREDVDIHVNDRPDDNIDTTDCIRRPADVYFVLDSSSSIWIRHFHHTMLNFVREVINRFDVGRQHTRVGVITFSDVAHTVFGLDSYLYKDELLKAVSENNIEYRPGLTNTADALYLAGRNFGREGRKGVQQVLVLITDGQSMVPKKTVSAARSLRQRGVKVLAVGVGMGVDRGELQAVTGDNSVMTVEDFDSLSQLPSLLAARSCQPVRPSLPDIPDIPYIPDIHGTPGPDDFPLADSDSDQCGLRHADMMVVYDWQMLGAVVTARLTNVLHSLADVLHARSADFSLGTVTSTICVDHQSMPLAGWQVWRQYGHEEKHSQLPAILEKVQRYAFSPANGHRPSANKVLLMVLDDTITPVLPQLLTEASGIRRENVRLFFLTSTHQGRELRQGLRAVGDVIQLSDMTFADPVLTSDLIARSLCAEYPSPDN